MASIDPGLATYGAEADDAKRGSIVEGGFGESDAPTAPDQFDPKYETTKLEIWAYYSYEPLRS